MTTTPPNDAPKPLPAPQAPLTSCEASPLAARLTNALAGSGHYYRQKTGAEEAPAPALPPPHQLSWHQLATLADADGNAGIEAWETVKEAARAELTSGHRAAAAIETRDSTPMDRARFLAVREELAAEWQPRGGVEWTLLDQMAQAHTLYLYWTHEFTMRTQTEAARDLKEQITRHSKERHGDWHYGEWVPQRVTEREAVGDASAHMDRWHRIFIRTLRQLRDLRRYSVVIQNAEQVNIGEKQINIAGD